MRCVVRSCIAQNEKKGESRWGEKDKRGCLFKKLWSRKAYDDIMIT